MANLRYATVNEMIDAALSATPALVTAYDENNLIDQRRAYTARTTSLAAQAIKADFAANVTANGAVIWAHNLTDAATRRLRLFNAVGQLGTLLTDVAAAAPHSAGLFDRWPDDRRFAVMYFDVRGCACI